MPYALDMKIITKKQDLAQKLHPFENKWVALTPDLNEVVSSGDTIDDVEEKMEVRKIQDAIFMKVPPADKIFVFTS
jgi:hypothetical protein